MSDVIAFLDDGTPTINGEVPKVSFEITGESFETWRIEIYPENYAAEVVMSSDPYVDVAEQ